MTASSATASTKGSQRIRDFLDELDASPIPAGNRELTEGLAFYGIVTPLYVRDYWYLLSGALRQAFDGNGLALALLADAYASKGPDGSYLNNSMEAFFAVSLPRRPDRDRAGRGRRRRCPPSRRPHPTLGRVVRLGVGQLWRLGPRRRRAPADDPGRGRRADRRGRHHARPRHAVRLVDRPSPSSSTRGSW